MKTQMKAVVLLWCIMAIMTYAAQENAQKGSDNFDQYPTGSLPTEWSATITGDGKSLWTVEKWPDAPSPTNVLKQSAEVAGGSFPLCVKENTAIKDGFVEVKSKAVSGKGDQAAGVMWRYRDKDNYYICRSNALEDNVVLYKVKNGKRTSLDIVGRTGGYGVEEKVSPEKWNTLRVEFAGNLFTVRFNGKELFKVQDKTFTEAGKVGLWTKADSVMMFDDFSYGSVGAAVAVNVGAAQTVNFDDTEVGKLSANWTGTQTSSGEPKWAVVADDTAPSKPNVLKQSGVATHGLCIKDDTNLKDGFVEVKFKPVSGTSDQAGGLIWRVKDTDNYYVTRANALGNNLSIYHTIKGVRVAFKGVSAKVTLGEWHTLRVDFQGNTFTVTFDGQKAIEATDDSLSDGGKVGVYTRSDSVTLFDDFSYGVNLGGNDKDKDDDEKKAGDTDKVKDDDEKK